MAKRKRVPAKKPLECVFYRTAAGNEIVLDWLRALPKGPRHEIGTDIRLTAEQFPIGKPLVDSLTGGLWEIRSNYDGVDYRTIFFQEGCFMFLLSGYQKTTRAAPRHELQLARARQKEVKSWLKQHAARNPQASKAKLRW